MQFEINRYYRSKKLGISAKLIEYNEKQAVLSVNNIRYRVPVLDLEPDTDVLVYDKDNDSTLSYMHVAPKTAKIKSISIDLHHFSTLSEAMAYLESELNEYFPHKNGRINIIHGKGDGTLRDGVHQYLHRNGIKYGRDPKNKGITTIM